MISNTKEKEYIELNKEEYIGNLLEIKMLWNNKIRHFKGICKNIKGKDLNTFIVLSRSIYRVEVTYELLLHNPRILNIKKIL
jgi:ribosomal protein L19